MTRKKTTEEFKKDVYDLVGNNFTILGEYINNKTSILIKCNKCNKTFTRQPQHLLNGRRDCPYCKNRTTKKITTEIFIKRVKEKYGDEYTVLGEYINNKTPIKIRHNVCGKEYATIPHYFINQENRCPNCFGNKRKTTEEFKKDVYDLVGDEYTVLGEYINNMKKILVRHNECGREYLVTPNCFIRGTRCPICSRKKMGKKLSNEEFLETLKKIWKDEFIPLEEYKDYDTPILVKHTKCGMTRKISPDRLFHNEHCVFCLKGKKKSDIEEEVSNYIKEIYKGEISLSDRKILNGKELDIYLPNLNLAFEIDGLYWHSDLFKPNNYHINKSDLCEEKNIRLIHIFEDEWNEKREIVKDKIKNLLHLTNNKIYARKCYIKEIDSKTKNKFLNENHIQGEDRSNIKLGLFTFENNQLVAVMTFCKPRIALGQKKNSEYDYELSRFATLLNYSIVGGFSKLFKYFIRNYSWKKIITYADKRYSQGDLYSKNNFNFLRESKPNYWYVVRTKRFHRFNFTKKSLKEKFPNSFSDNKTEKEIMEELNYNRIYDCGNLVFEYIK